MRKTWTILSAFAAAAVVVYLACTADQPEEKEEL